MIHSPKQDSGSRPAASFGNVSPRPAADLSPRPAASGDASKQPPVGALPRGGKTNSEYAGVGLGGARAAKKNEGK